MAGVFVSHAFADKGIVDPFVDDVIRLGCEVPRKQIFYSSGEDTGVPSGVNLNTYVRDQVALADNRELGVGGSDVGPAAPVETASRRAFPYVRVRDVLSYGAK